MKTNQRYLIFLIVVAFSTLLAFCKKKEEIKAVITVKYRQDTTKTAPNAKVELYVDPQKVSDQNKLPYLTNNIVGVTDASGEFRYTFKYEAIYDLIASKDSLCGKTVLRLKPDKTVYKSILIDKCK